jgi:hypothetical protein
MIGQLADGNRLVDMSKTLAAGGHLMSALGHGEPGEAWLKNPLVIKHGHNNNVSKWTYIHVFRL